MAYNKRWRDIRGQRALNENRVATYKRLMGAQVKLTELRAKRGLSQADLAKALNVTEPNISRVEQEDDIYLSTLSRYVSALGGHLEVRAVFPEETVTVVSGADPVTIADD
ncbi:MAG TPA: XRE family transcriptional regulator [Solirubrobacteraceae bacterium]|jgi:DNA-binding XRE family transcriptional regulator|nr:XRE family transcriptional regulator [Solirubrobacteraceae bacterium]